MKTLLGTVLAVAVAGLSLPALAGEAKVGAIEITSAWARATPAKAPAPPPGPCICGIFTAAP